MVEDEKIKTTVSPFAIREGEIKTFDGKDGYVSINQIIHKINLGHISEIHFQILELVNEFEFMTSRQIYQLLLSKNADIKSQDKLNNKLDQLVKSKILTRYYFTSEEGKGIYRIYCLEKMGKYLLNSKEIEYDILQTYDTICRVKPNDLLVFVDVRYRIWQQLKIGFRFEYSIISMRTRHFQATTYYDEQTRKQRNNSLSLYLVYMLNEAKIEKKKE